MFTLLLKKQFFECFRGYFVNTKTGKMRSRASRIGMFALFIFVFITLGFSFFGMSMLFVPILETEYSWIYYGVFAIIAIMLSIFIGSFSASNSLYKSKDNDLLLSMPIKTKDILLSRICVVYFLSILYSGCVWLPICLNAWINVRASILIIVLDILLLFVIGLFVSAFSCLVGYIISLIANRAKNKSLITVLTTIFFLGVYYVCYFRLNDIFDSLVKNGESVSGNIKTYALFIFFLSKGALGDITSFVLFLLISVIIFVIVYYFLNKSFINIIASSNNIVKTNTKAKIMNKTSSKNALLKKEFIHFFNLPVYLTNSGLGVLFVIGLTILAFINKTKIDDFLILINEGLPFLKGYIPLCLAELILLLISLNCISCPSISLEGKNLWILKSLPIKTYEIFEAKERMHVLFNGIPSILCSIILAILLDLSISDILYIVVIIFLFIEIQSLIGLTFGILRPNFNWTNEVQPIKQSLNILFVWLIGLFLIVAIAGLLYLSMDVISIENYTMAVIIVMMFIVVILRRWLRNKGTILFEKL